MKKEIYHGLQMLDEICYYWKRLCDELEIIYVSRMNGYNWIVYTLLYEPGNLVSAWGVSILRMLTWLILFIYFRDALFENKFRKKYRKIFGHVWCVFSRKRNRKKMSVLLLFLFLILFFLPFQALLLCYYIDKRECI